jgi:hypothetical protein
LQKCDGENAPLVARTDSLTNNPAIRYRSNNCVTQQAGAYLGFIS